MRVLLTGATGFIGSRLVEKLDQPVVLSRDPASAKKTLGEKIEVHAWDAKSAVPQAALEGVEGVINLAGASVADGRWTDARKKILRDSRLQCTRNLVDSLAVVDPPPRVLVSASAVGYYGDRGEEELKESSDPGNDFLAKLCGDWEAEAAKAKSLGLRVVTPRIGVVLGPGGGALSKMLLPFRLGLGSPLGSGKQWMPWVHRQDLVELFLFALKNNHVSGAVNAVAPNPVTNKEFTKALGKALHRPTFMPAVPKFVLKTMLGEFTEVLLASQKVIPKAAEAAGFSFQYGKLETALQEIFS